MAAEVWVALFTLVFTILTSAVGSVVVILNRISDNKEQLDTELTAIRIAAYEEYKILRREMQDGSQRSSVEFGESIKAIREKVTQVEIWFRDEISKVRHTLTGGMDMRYSLLEQRLDEIDKSVKSLEIENARRQGIR